MARAVSMAACSVHSNWLVTIGSLENLLQLVDTAGCIDDDTSEVQAQLSRPPGGPSCALCMSCLPGACARLVLISSAKSCEVSVQRQGATGLSYVITVRGQATSDKKRFKTEIGLQGLPPCSLLEIKLLSLQGIKDACSIHKLVAVVQQPSQQPESCANQDTHFGQPNKQQQSSSSDPPSEQLSQMDQLHLLVDSIHTGNAGSRSVPESLQLLYSKAMQQPTTGMSASVKLLSAMVAQGMLLQQKGQQQQQQLTGHGTDSSCHAIQERFAQTNQGPAAASGSRHVKKCDQLDLSPVLAAIQCLERKVESIADKVLGSIQQLDKRLAAIEHQVCDTLA